MWKRTKENIFLFLNMSFPLWPSRTRQEGQRSMIRAIKVTSNASWNFFVVFLSEKSLWIFINNACPIPCAILFKVQTNVDNKRQPSSTGLDRCEKVFTFFQRVQVQFRWKESWPILPYSCLICHIILSCIHSIHWKAAALFNITQRVTEPLAWLHSATVLMFAEMPKSKEINNSQFPWKIWGKGSDGLIKKNTASISAFKGCKTSQLYPTSQINYEIHKSPNWDSCF